MSRSRAKVVNKSDIMGAIGMKGPVGWLVATAAMGIMGLGKVNRLYDKNKELQGPDFSAAILKDLDITCDIRPEQLDLIPQEGSFITVSNHSYGSIDGMMLSSIIGTMRPDYKILTNFILSMIPTLKDTFLPVNPFTAGESKRSSIRGLRMAKELLATGGSLGLFPAGEVATYQRGEKKSSVMKGRRIVEDIPWPSNMIKLIKNANVPVIPIYFDGCNSRLFHLLGRIHPMLRTIMLPREMLNKKGRCIHVRIGRPIAPSELAEYDDLQKLGGYLRNRVYAMESEFGGSNAVAQPSSEPDPLALPKDKKAVIKEFEKIKGNKLFDVAQFSCYLASYDEIPNIIHEIGRRREEAFRATGEGTGKALDLDEFDRYYKHLILFDTRRRKLAGAYRMGIGSEIFESHGGVEGFYTNTLFQFKPQIVPMLKESVELGRSFVSVEYQKEALPLMLLLKGLMHALLKYPDAKYFIGPVSISNSYPKFYQSLMVHYIESKHTLPDGESLVAPTTPFEPDFLRVDPDALLSHKMGSLEKFDRFLMRLSDNEYRLPTLVKKYIKINARILCFNVDPLFNYSLDGLILLKLSDYPKAEVMSMTKELAPAEKEQFLNRFGYSLK